jgi:hypothetical protein
MDFDGVDAASLPLQTYEAHANIASDQSFSPPSSLMVKLDGPDRGCGGSYYLPFTFTPKTARLEYEFKAVTFGSWVTTLGVSLFEESSQTGRVLQVLVSPQGGLQVQEFISTPDAGTPYSHATFPLDGGGEALGVWHHVVLSMTVDDSKQQYLSSLTVDGEVLEADVPLMGPWAQGKASVAVGSTWAQGGGSQFYYDNVRADFGL